MKFSTLFLAALFVSQSAFAAGYDEVEDESYVTYDSIVQDLQSQSSRTSKARGPKVESGDPFENVWLHAGAGYTQMTQNIALPNGSGVHFAGRGIQAAVGIDILGPSLAAEGAMRSFGESEDSSNRVNLKEFDLKVFLKMRPQDKIALRFGGGLSARYMTVRTPAQTFDATTPASIVTVGGDLYLTEAFSVGFDVGARNAMVADSFDRSSYDGTVRLDAHF